MKYETIEDVIEAHAWERMDNYCGADFSDYVVLIAQHRDSNVLEQSNFASFLDALGGEKEGKVEVIRSGHWAVGWVEGLYVKKTQKRVLEKAREILNAYEDYPVIDESDYNEREQAYIEESFEQWKDDYMKHVREFSGLKRIPKKTLEAVTYELYQSACGYYGAEDAHVDADNISKLIGDCYFRDHIKDTTLVKVLTSKASA